MSSRVHDRVMKVIRDLVELGKPRITLMVLVTSAVGLWMAPGGLGRPLSTNTYGPIPTSSCPPLKSLTLSAK